jgi:hypothetical protein
MNRRPKGFPAADEVEKKPRLDTDPAPGARVYYRHTLTGDRGFHVMRGGKPHVRYDNPMMDRTVPFNPRDWQPETAAESQPLTIAALGRVAFEADRALCLALGLHRESRKEWLQMPESERVDFMMKGPASAHPDRAKLFSLVMHGLAHLAK